MTALKYSPGKWIPGAGGFVRVIGEDRHSEVLCECTLGDDVDEMQSNAVLMAAAPEMYEILKAICESKQTSEIFATREVNDLTVALREGIRLLNRLEKWDRKNYERMCWLSTVIDYYKWKREFEKCQ